MIEVQPKSQLENTFATQNTHLASGSFQLPPLLHHWVKTGRLV